MKKLMKLLDGWKTVIGYLGAQIFGSYPLVLTAFNEWLGDPSDKQKASNFVVQLVIALGLVAKVTKNLKHG